MRIIKNILILISVTLIFACQTNRPENIDISGKWWSYNISETEYCEYNIDKESIGHFSHYMGNMSSTQYSINKDTLFYLDGKFRLNMISDNQFTITIQDITDTLTRLPDSIITFHEIDSKDDSIFNTFYTQFTDRAHYCWIKYGYVTEEELENSIIKEGEIEEELIHINKK